jgi:hypothetical protein
MHGLSNTPLLKLRQLLVCGGGTFRAETQKIITTDHFFQILLNLLSSYPTFGLNGTPHDLSTLSPLLLAG